MTGCGCKQLVDWWLLCTLFSWPVRAARRIYTEQQWMFHRDRNQGRGCLENFSMKLKKRKLKFPLKKKEEKCRLCFSQQCQMLGGIASRRQVMKELWFSMKKEREKFPRKFFPSKKCTFPLKMRKKIRSDNSSLVLVRPSIPERTLSTRCQSIAIQ